MPAVSDGECHLDIENPCNICEGWTSKQWGKLRRSLVDVRARASQRGRQHWTAAFPRLEAWILSRPVSASSSGPASEISSLVGEGGFDDNLLVSTPSLLVQQVLVVQTQNGVNMASSRILHPAIRHPCRLRHPCRTLRIRHPCRMLPCLLCQQGLLYQWVIMVRAISSLLCLTPIG